MAPLKKALGLAQAKLKDMELQMKSADQAVKAANLWVNNAKLQLKDYRTSLAFFADAIANPALLAEHLFKKIWPTEAFMRVFSRTQVGEDLMH